MGVCSSTAANELTGGRRHHPMHAHTPHSDARASSGAHQTRSSPNDVVAVANLDDGSSFAASVQGDGTSHRSKRKSLKPHTTAAISLSIAPILIPQTSHTTAVTPRTHTHTPSVNAHPTAVGGGGIAGQSHPPTPSMSRSRRTPKLVKTSGSYKKLAGATVIATGRKSKSRRMLPQSELLLHPAVDSLSAAESSCSGLGPPLTREERIASGDRSALRLPGASGKSSPSPFELDPSKQKELSESMRPRKVSTIRPIPSSLRPEITSTPMTGPMSAGEDVPEHIDLSGPPPLPERPRDHRSSRDALSDFHALTPPHKLSSRQKRKAANKKSPNLRPTSAVSSQGDSQDTSKQKRKWFRAIRHRLRLSKSNSAGMRALSLSLSGANDPQNESGSKSRNLFTSPSQGMFKKRGAVLTEHPNAATYGNTTPFAYTPGLVGHGAHTPTSKTDRATFATDTLKNRGSLTSVASRPSVSVAPLSTKNLRTHYENQKGAEKRSRVQITAQILKDNIQSSVAQEQLEKQHMEKWSGSSRGQMQETDAESLTSKTSSGVYDRARRDQCKRTGARAFNNRRLSEAYSSVTTDSEKYYDVSGDHSHLSRHDHGVGGGRLGGVHHAKHDSGSFASERDGEYKMISRQNSEKSQRPVCLCAAAEALFAATQPLHVVMCDEYCSYLHSSSRHRSSSPPTTIDLRDRPNRPSADGQRRRIAAKLNARRHHHHSLKSSSAVGQQHHHHRTSEKPLPPLPTKPLPAVPSNGGRSRSRQRPPTTWRPSLSKPISADELNLALDGSGHAPKAHHRNGGDVSRSHLPEHLRTDDFPDRHPAAPSPMSSGAVSLRQNTLLQQHQKRVGAAPQEIQRVDMSAGERLLHNEY